MFTDYAEAKYLQKRVDASQAMACAATNNCARLAHEALVDQYQHKLAELRRDPSPGRSVTLADRALSPTELIAA